MPAVGGSEVATCNGTAVLRPVATALGSVDFRAGIKGDED